jgi:oligopeptidase B
MLKIALVCLFLLTSCSKKESEMPAPKAVKIEHETKAGDNAIRDNYFWMRDKGWPKSVTEEPILTHLKEENAYTEHFFKSLDSTTDKLFNELKGRIKLTDQDVYTKVDNYYYYTRTEEALSYPIFCRKFGAMDAPEEIVLDVNQLAEGKKFTKIGAVAVNSSHSKLAYSVDFAGDEKCEIKVWDFDTGQHMSDSIKNCAGNIVWHNNREGFFYTPVREDHRVDTVMFHDLGSDAKVDKKIFAESNAEYQVMIEKSKSRQYLFIGSEGHSDSEKHLVSLNDDALQTQLIKAKKANIKYEVEHNGNYIYMLTNDVGDNFRIVRSEIQNLNYDNWAEYIPLDKNKPLDDFDMSEDYLVLNYKQDGLSSVKMLHLKDGRAQFLTFPDEAYAAVGSVSNFLENDLRVEYSSLSRPRTIYSYDFDKNKLNILKETEIPTGHQPDDYQVKRVWAMHGDTKIPVSLVYKKSLFKNDGSNPLYLYGYGSYGIEVAPSFRSTILSLVDRGFVYAIAHIRGGSDLGYDWYLSAKFLNKKNTFEDFIACTEMLINDKYTSKGNIVIMGGSAGGMLVGAAINMKPDLYKAVVAHVPFVDVLNTMLDETLPLTPLEYNEWGNPKDPKYFDYIKSYSPYDNIVAQNYPHIYVTAGISDPRVGYWEPAKWVAKLREMKTDESIVLLKTNLDAGHQGASGRFDALKEVAEEFAFIIKIFNINM